MVNKFVRTILEEEDSFIFTSSKAFDKHLEIRSSVTENLHIKVKEKITPSSD
jgi:hypothetical protein